LVVVDPHRQLRLKVSARDVLMATLAITEESVEIVAKLSGLRSRKTEAQELYRLL
jgi:hypothetical protein